MKVLQPVMALHKFSSPASAEAVCIPASEQRPDAGCAPQERPVFVSLDIDRLQVAPAADQTSGERLVPSSEEAFIAQGGSEERGALRNQVELGSSVEAKDAQPEAHVVEIAEEVVGREAAGVSIAGPSEGSGDVQPIHKRTLSGVWASLQSTGDPSSLQIPGEGLEAKGVGLRERRAVSLAAPPRKPLEGGRNERRPGLSPLPPLERPGATPANALNSVSPAGLSSPGSDEARDSFPDWRGHLPSGSNVGSVPLLHRSLSSTADYGRPSRLSDGVNSRARATPGRDGTTPGRRRPSFSGSREGSLPRTASGGLARKSPARGILGSRLISWLSWDSNIDTCRICQLPDSSDQPLIDLGCACQHGLEKAHEPCIKQWFESRGTNQCEVCKQIAVNIPAPPPLPAAAPAPSTSAQGPDAVTRGPSRLASVEETGLLGCLEVFSLHRRPFFLIVWGVLLLVITRLFFDLLDNMTPANEPLVPLLGVVFGILVVLGLITLARIIVEIVRLIKPSIRLPRRHPFGRGRRRFGRRPERASETGEGNNEVSLVPGSLAVVHEVPAEEAAGAASGLAREDSLRNRSSA